MADAVYDVSVRDRTKRGFKSAEKQAGGFTKRINAGFSKIKVPALIAGGAAIAGIALLTSKLGGFLSEADRIDKASARTGLGALAIQRLGFAAEQSGASFEVVEKGITRLVSSLDDAALNENSPAAKALDRIGLSLADLEGLTTEEKFAKIAGALGQVADDGEQAALAQDLFGRSGVELIPLFEAGEEGITKLGDAFEATGNVMSDDAVKAGAAATDALNRVKNVISGVATSALTALLPALTSVISFMEKTVIPIVRDQVVPVIKAIAEVAFALIKTGWDTVLKPVLTAIVAIIKDSVVPPIRDVLIPILIEIGEKAFERIKTLWETVLKPTIDNIKGLFGGAGDGSGSESLSGVINVLKKTFEIVFGLIGVAVTFAVDIILAQIDLAIGIITGIVTFLTAVFQGDWDAAWEAIKGIFNTFLDTIEARAQAVIDLIVGIFDVFGIDIEAVVTGLLDNVIGFFEGFSADVQSVVKGAANGVIGFFEGMANGVIGAINAILRAWNSLQLEIPAVKDPIFGKVLFAGAKIGVPVIPEIAALAIPRLQGGGIVPATPGGRLVIAGEGGFDEEIRPLDGRNSGRTVVELAVTIVVQGSVVSAGDLIDYVLEQIDIAAQRGDVELRLAGSA